MKKTTIVFLSLVFLALIAGIATWILSQNAKKKERSDAQMQFDAQISEKWNQITNTYDLISKNCESKPRYKDFALSHYKELKKIHTFTVPATYQNTYQPQVQEFYDQVLYPMQDLFNLMSEPISGDKKQLEDILDEIRETELKLSRYQLNHHDLSPPPQKEELLKNRLAKIYISTPPKTESPKVIVVNNYPSWITTASQREAYTSMVSIARQYFAARRALNRQLNWSYGKRDYSYFSRSEVRAVLANAIAVRENLYSQVRVVKAVEGMSVLASQLEEMLENSYRGLQALYDNQDYPTFNSYNQRNNAISAKIRRTFGI